MTTLPFWKRTGLLQAVLAIALAGGMSFHAQAADDDEDDLSFEQKIIEKILGSDENKIDYRERSPLVVPPKIELPRPESAGVNNPAWPKDADNQPRRKKTAAAPRQREWESNDDRPLLPSELNRPGARAGQGRPTEPVRSTNGGELLSPSELGYKGGLFDFFKGGKDEEAVAFTGEPKRAGMTDPPPGYLTPSPAHPYGLTKRQEAPKPYSIYDRGTESWRQQ